MTRDSGSEEESPPNAVLGVLVTVSDVGDRRNAFNFWKSLLCSVASPFMSSVWPLVPLLVAVPFVWCCLDIVEGEQEEEDDDSAILVAILVTNDKQCGCPLQFTPARQHCGAIRAAPSASRPERRSQWKADMCVGAVG